MNREREGLLLCLVSAAGFGAMPIFAKQAYATGLELTPLLALRFAMASAMLWALILLRRRALGSWRGLAAGAASASSATPSRPASTSARSSASTPASPRCCSTPTPRSSRSRPSRCAASRPRRRKLGALALASGGVALVLAGGGPGEIDLLGAGMALGSALFYTGFILISDRVAAHTPPVAFAASVATGAGGDVRDRGAARGRLRGAAARA